MCRWRNTRMADPTIDRAAKGCKVQGCDRPHTARGWCARHYARWRKYGDPEAGGPERENNVRGAPEARFWAYTRAIPDGCWEWQGSLDQEGYARFQVGQKIVKAYRWSYEQFVGPVPDGQVLDHLCRNRACVRPDHLEPVENRENILRGVGVTARNARKTHCKRGHEFTPENTYTEKGGRRTCRTCKTEREKKRAKERWQRKKSKRPS